MPSRPQSKPSPQWQEYVWRATLSGQRGSGAAGSRPLRWVDGASGSAAVSLRRSKAIEPASRPKSHGISVSALNTVAPNAASKVGGAMVEACRIRQGPAHFTRPPVACRFAPIVGVPSYHRSPAGGEVMMSRCHTPCSVASSTRTSSSNTC